jgi:hypothetical protein
VQNNEENMHDIRQSIPFTDQTNPGKFPQYEFRAYPKMMIDEKGKPYLNAAKQPVVVNDSHEEKSFKEAQIVHVSVPASGISSGAIAALANESEEVIALRAELAALRAAPVVEKKKPGRPAKVKADLPADLG